MTGWRCVKMSRPEGEAAWVHIHDTLEGEHHYKFLVDGLWCVEEAEPTVEAEDKVWNVMEVKKTDFEVFEALACDSFSLKMSEKNKLENKFNSDSWCQVDNEYQYLTPPHRPPSTGVSQLREAGHQAADPAQPAPAPAPGQPRHTTTNLREVFAVPGALMPVP